MLTIDIGNTRIKWGLWHDDQISERGDCEHNNEFSMALFGGCLPECSEIKRVWVANVAAKSAEFELQQWLKTNGGAELHVFKTEKQCCGMVNAYAEPSQHGVDRWAALLGARTLYEENLCVIDAGTAVTVDFMNNKGKHQGGVILPGINMMQKALLTGTSGLSIDRNWAEDEIDLLATDTTGAVVSGTHCILRSGLQEICDQAMRLYDNNVKIIITGGAAEKLCTQLKSPTIIFDPDLVLRGLHSAASR